MIQPSDYLAIKDNALVVYAERFCSSQRPSDDLSNVLSSLVSVLHSPNIIVDMEGVKILNNHNAPILFGKRVNDATIKNVTIQATHASEKVSRSLDDLFSFLITTTDESTHDLLNILQSTSE